MKCPCPCGQSDLIDEPTLGLMTIADVICEYRSCRNCKSTRPFIHPIEIDGEKILLYHDPTSKRPVRDSMGAGGEDVLCEWDNLLDAIETGPIADVAELRRNGVVLARAFCGIDGVIGWRVLSPLDET